MRCVMGWWWNNVFLCVFVSWVKWSWVYCGIYKPEGLWLSFSSWLFMWQMDKRNPRFMCPFQPPGKINQLSRKSLKYLNVENFIYLSFDPVLSSLVKSRTSRPMESSSCHFSRFYEAPLCAATFSFFLVFFPLKRMHELICQCQNPVN